MNLLRWFHSISTRCAASGAWAGKQENKVQTCLKWNNVLQLKTIGQESPKCRRIPNVPWWKIHLSWSPQGSRFICAFDKHPAHTLQRLSRRQVGPGLHSMLAIESKIQISLFGDVCVYSFEILLYCVGAYMNLSFWCTDSWSTWKPFKTSGRIVGECGDDGHWMVWSYCNT